MKRKISITVDEEIYKKLISAWKTEQEKVLKLENPKPVKLSEIAEKILKKGLER